MRKLLATVAVLAVLVGGCCWGTGIDDDCDDYCDDCCCECSCDCDCCH